MLVVFSPIFVAGTKIISSHDFVAPLKVRKLLQYNQVVGTEVRSFFGNVVS